MSGSGVMALLEQLAKIAVADVLGSYISEGLSTCGISFTDCQSYLTNGTATSGCESELNECYNVSD